jgi:DNA gyrase/topoisomerase IV subunit A
MVTTNIEKYNMDANQFQNITNSVVQRINNLNNEVSHKECRDLEEKEKELKVLNDLFSSLRKTTNFYNNKK